MPNTIKQEVKGVDTQKGTLVISLDFELYWGVRDKKNLDIYQDNLLGVRAVVPRLLNLFDKYKVHATWATVGFLFLKDRQELIQVLPKNKPNYSNVKLSPYTYLEKIGCNEAEDPFHYASSLIDMVASFPTQEIGTHTFSHYYCLEKGQTADTFREDLKTAIKVAKNRNIDIKSIVFPRNQFNKEYIDICKENGLLAYRGNQLSWLYKATSQEDESSLRRALRLIDAYLNISGHNCYSIKEIPKAVPADIRSSRFLRPYSKKMKLGESLRLKRILSDLTYAAKKGLIYHLWWHPHNFGTNTEENFSFLEKILEHYLQLQNKYEIQSLNMGELAELVTYER